ncbi:PilZ domain-containing protein [Sphingomonas gellani]|uniref:PilZ domain-containing protein n=1 Tax=Sphingomonas gellani TaxID=1166340 RepID=A0A1H8G4H0_9SPHN|nr:PilZ domain-containing protein [Sphingomonas gellani]SEN38779.1 PilZ domain-containing protein [Sphingomonas gellani]
MAPIMAQASERRGLHRRGIAVEGELCSIRLGRSSCAVVDLSPTGCRVIRTPRLAPEDRVMLRLPSFAPRGARVAWWRDGIAGLEFGTPLGTAVVDHIVARHGTRD